MPTELLCAARTVLAQTAEFQMAFSLCDQYIDLAAVDYEHVTSNLALANDEISR